jgi:hypothetical protein
MEILSKFGRPLGAAAGMIVSAALLAGCVAAEAGYPSPGGPGAPPEYAQNTGPQGGGYYNPPAGGYGAPASEGYGPPPGGSGYGGPGAEGYGPPPGGGGYGPPAAEGYGPPPGGSGYGPPAAEGYGPPPGGGYGGHGITRERFIARARHRAIMHGRNPELAARRAARKFNRIDADHNGVIERGEMQAWRAAHPPHWRAQGAAPGGGYGYGAPGSEGYGPPPGGGYQQY